MSTSTQSAWSLPKNLPPGALVRMLNGANGLPKGAILRPVEAHAAADRKNPPMGATEPETGRPVLQQSSRAEVNQAAATAEHPSVKAQIEAILGKIDGAHLAGARDEKDADRREEKIEQEGQSPRTVRDYSGFRIAVDFRPAKEELVAALRKHFEIPDEQDEFERGNPETGFHGHTLQVREAGSPVSHEVQVLPREVAEHADDDHALYEKARDGNDRAAAQLKSINKSRWADFAKRQDTEKTTKYKLGSTQANVPPESDASKALDTFRAGIPEEHLAGDGIDVGDGGNHVTLRYGIRGDDTSGIENYLRSQAPFTAKLGKTATFAPSEHSDGASPLVAEVESPELTRMNQEIEKHGDFAPPSFKEYKPHATIAYLDPKQAKQYAGRDDLKGKEFQISSIAISDREGNQKNVPLQGSSAANSQPAPQKLTKGAVVQLADGRAGVVKHYQPPVNGGAARVRVRTADGKIVDGVKPDKLRVIARPEQDPDKTWVGVDMDGTLAHYDGFKGDEAIGAPVEREVQHVQDMLRNGENVRIFTARVANDRTGSARSAIEAWCQQHLGQVLPITNVKDDKMVRIEDDRAVQVKMNDGHVVGGPAALKEAMKAHRKFGKR